MRWAAATRVSELSLGAACSRHATDLYGHTLRSSQHGMASLHSKPLSCRPSCHLPALLRGSGLDALHGSF